MSRQGAALPFKSTCRCCLTTGNKRHWKLNHSKGGKRNLSLFMNTNKCNTACVCLCVCVCEVMFTFNTFHLILYANTTNMLRGSNRHHLHDEEATNKSVWQWHGGVLDGVLMSSRDRAGSYPACGGFAYVHLNSREAPSPRVLVIHLPLQLWSWTPQAPTKLWKTSTSWSSSHWSAYSRMVRQIVSPVTVFFNLMKN